MPPPLKEIPDPPMMQNKLNKEAPIVVDAKVYWEAKRSNVVKKYFQKQRRKKYFDASSFFRCH